MIQEWTEQELVQLIFSKYKLIDGQKWYDLDAMKAMTFDPRFPKHKLKAATEFMVMVDELQKQNSPLIKSNI